MYCLRIQVMGFEGEGVTVWITFFDRSSTGWELKGNHWNIGPHGGPWTLLRSSFCAIIGIKSITGVGSRENKEELNTDSVVYGMGAENWSRNQRVKSRPLPLSRARMLSLSNDNNSKKKRNWRVHWGRVFVFRKGKDKKLLNSILFWIEEGWSLEHKWDRSTDNASRRRRRKSRVCG